VSLCHAPKPVLDVTATMRLQAEDYKRVRPKIITYQDTTQRQLYSLFGDTKFCAESKLLIKYFILFPPGM
jgi:hypothetical protein